MALVGRLIFFGLLVVAVPMSGLSGRIDAAVTAPELSSRGDLIEIKVKTKARALCRIESSNEHIASVVEPHEQYADDKGNAVWKLSVPHEIEASQLPFVVTVSKSGQEDVGVCVVNLK